MSHRFPILIAICSLLLIASCHSKTNGRASDIAEGHPSYFRSIANIKAEKRDNTLIVTIPPNAIARGNVGDKKLTLLTASNKTVAQMRGAVRPARESVNVIGVTEVNSDGSASVTLTSGIDAETILLSLVGSAIEELTKETPVNEPTVAYKTLLDDDPFYPLNPDLPLNPLHQITGSSTLQSNFCARGATHKIQVLAPNGQPYTGFSLDVRTDGYERKPNGNFVATSFGVFSARSDCGVATGSSRSIGGHRLTLDAEGSTSFVLRKTVTTNEYFFRMKSSILSNGIAFDDAYFDLTFFNEVPAISQVRISGFRSDPISMNQCDSFSLSVRDSSGAALLPRPGNTFSIRLLVKAMNDISGPDARGVKFYENLADCQNDVGSIDYYQVTNDGGSRNIFFRVNSSVEQAELFIGGKTLKLGPSERGTSSATYVGTVHSLTIAP